MPYRSLCVMRCAPLEIVVPRQEEISGAATDGNPPNGGVERDSGRVSGFAAYRSTVLSTVRVAKCEKSRDERRQASSRALTAASVVRCSHKTTTKCL